LTTPNCGSSSHNQIVAPTAGATIHGVRNKMRRAVRANLSWCSISASPRPIAMCSTTQALVNMIETPSECQNASSPSTRT
jgi:hypothetical protein